MLDMTTFNLFEKNSTKKCVKHILEDIEANAHMNDEHRFNLRLVLNELIINGFEHGGACTNSPLIVAYQLDDSEKMLEITVDDGGKGFDYNTIKDSNQLAFRGRGLLLVNALCEKIDYNQNGSKITVELAI